MPFWNSAATPNAASPNHAFKEAGLDALNAAGQGTLATLFALSGSPYAALGAVVSAAFAGVSVWRGIQAIGKGRQSAAQSTAADTILQVLYPPESPGTVVTDAESPGRVTSTTDTRCRDVKDALFSCIMGWPNRRAGDAARFCSCMS